jgi:hypothetical protein
LGVLAEPHFIVSNAFSLRPSPARGQRNLFYGQKYQRIQEPGQVFFSDYWPAYVGHLPGEPFWCWQSGLTKHIERLARSGSDTRLGAEPGFLKIDYRKIT